MVPQDFYGAMKESVEVCSVLFNKAGQKLIKKVLLPVSGSRA